MAESEDAFLRLHLYALTQDQKRELYGRCRLALCASAIEDFVYYILEAAACGCQVVTTTGMPTRSLLRIEGQGALAARAVAGGRHWNLVLEYKVTDESIFLEAQELLGRQLEYSPEAYRGNLELQLQSFLSHLDILDVHLRMPTHADRHVLLLTVKTETVHDVSQPVVPRACAVTMHTPNRICAKHAAG